MNAPERKREEFVDPASLTPWKDNPRINDAASVEVENAIREFGFLDPIIARASDRMIIAGHTRHKAATRMGLDAVPVIFLDIDEGEAHRLAVLHNRLGERAEWDPLKLLDLAEDGLDLQGAGWSEIELDDLFASMDDTEKTPRLSKEATNSGGKAARRLSVTLHLYTDEADELEELFDKAGRPGESRAETVLRCLHAAGDGLDL